MAEAGTCRCNICGKTFDEWDAQENFGFNYWVGYGSKYDGDHIRARFCCDCFDKLIDVMREKCVICPVAENDDPVNQPDIDAINVIDE